MNKNDIWNTKLKQLFCDTNNIIIRVLVKNTDANMRRQSSIKFYLASKDQDEVYFHDGLEVLFKDGCKYDDNSNLLILNNEDQVVKEIANEKIFAFKEEHLVGESNEDFDFFINLPLSSAISLDQFKKTNGLAIVNTEARIKDEAIELLQEKLKAAVLYDSNQAFDKILPMQAQNIVIELENVKEERE